MRVVGVRGDINHSIFGKNIFSTISFDIDSKKVRTFIKTKISVSFYIRFDA